MIGFTVVIAVLVLLTGGSSSPFLLTRSAEQYAAEAVQQYARAPVVHMVGTFTGKTHRYQVDISENRSSELQGTVGEDGAQFQLRYVGDRAYVQGGTSYWQVRGVDLKLSLYLAGKWTVSSLSGLSVTLDLFNRDLPLLDLSSPARRAALQKGGSATIRGTPAVELRGSSGSIYVSASPPTRLLRVTSAADYRTGDGSSALRLDLDYPSGLSVRTPSPAIDPEDPRALPARFEFVPSTFRFQGCDGPSGCSMLVTVRNTRGPLIGTASVDFKLTNEGTGADLGTCTAPVKQVDYNQTEEVSCTVTSAAWTAFTRVGGRYHGQAVAIHNSFYD